MTKSRQVPQDGERVMVECWCHQSFVWLPIEQVRAGKTKSCHRPDCKETP